MSSREGEALVDEEDDTPVSTEDEPREDGKLTATGFDLEPVGSDEVVPTAEFKGAGKLPNPGDDDEGAAAVSLTVAGSVEGSGGGGGCSASGEGSITTTVVELFVSGRSGSKSAPSTGVTVQVVGVAAAMLMVELNLGDVEASENEAKVSDGSLDSEETVLMFGLGVSKLMVEGDETSADAGLDDDGTVLTGEDSITDCVDGVHDTIVGGAMVGVATEVAPPGCWITKGMDNNDLTFMATIGREKWGATLTEGDDVKEGVAIREVPLRLVVGAGKLFTMEDLMRGAGAFVKLCALTCCLAEFCRAGMADAVTMDGGSETGKRLHGPGGKLSRDDAAITAGGSVELERLRVDELAATDLRYIPACGCICEETEGAFGRMVTWI